MCASKKRNVEISWCSSESEDNLTDVDCKYNTYDVSPVIATNRCSSLSNTVSLSPVIASLRKERLRKNFRKRICFKEEESKDDMTISQFVTPLSSTTTESFTLFEAVKLEDTDANLKKEQKSSFVALDMLNKSPDNYVISQFCSQESNCTMTSTSSLFCEEEDERHKITIDSGQSSIDCEQDFCTDSDGLISQFNSLEYSSQLRIYSLKSQDASTVCSEEMIPMKYLHEIPPKDSKQPKSKLALDLMKMYNMRQAKMSIWKYESSKGIESSPEKLKYAVEFRVKCCDEEFGHYVLNCEILCSTNLFENKEYFHKCLLNVDSTNINLNTIDKNNCVVIINRNIILNAKFLQDLQFFLYPPYDIKINQESNICYFLNVYKIKNV